MIRVPDVDTGFDAYLRADQVVAVRASTLTNGAGVLYRDGAVVVLAGGLQVKTSLVVDEVIAAWLKGCCGDSSD